jgi:hypothetical protein
VIGATARLRTVRRAGPYPRACAGQSALCDASDASRCSVTTYSTVARCVTVAYCAARLAPPVSPSASPNLYAHALDDPINLLGPDGLCPCYAALDEDKLAYRCLVVALASLSSRPTLPWGQEDRRRYGR